MSIEIFPLVHQLIDARDAKGYETYGQRCQANDGRDTLQDIIEETADALVYLVKLKAERDEAAYTPHYWTGNHGYATGGNVETPTDRPRRWWHCDRCDGPVPVDHNCD